MMKLFLLCPVNNDILHYLGLVFDSYDSACFYGMNLCQKCRIIEFEVPDNIFK